MTAICDQFYEIQGRLSAKGTPAVRVSFSHAGFMKAMSELDKNRSPYFADPRGMEGEFTTYMGLPFSVRSDQQGELGLHTEHDIRPGAVKIRLQVFPPELDMLVVGSQLSRAQLSDIIDGWISAHPNESPVTDMLVDWIQTHGRFE